MAILANIWLIRKFCVAKVCLQKSAIAAK